MVVLPGTTGYSGGPGIRCRGSRQFPLGGHTRRRSAAAVAVAMTQVEPLGPGREFDLIRSITRDLPDHPRVLIGPGDDAAVLSGGLVISCDASVENVHFRRDWLSAEEIGYRAAAVALSDIAAMAAQP